MNGWKAWLAGMVIGLALLASTATPAAAARGYRFEIIASSEGRLQTMRCPAINDRGEVAFSGLRDNGSGGVFRSNGGALDTIADTRDGINGSSSDVDINDRGQVAFAALLDSGGEAILRSERRGLTTIAATENAQFDFFSFSPSINNAGQVAFKAGLDAEFNFDEGVFVGDGNSVAPRYLTSETPFLGEESGPAINNDGVTAFVEQRDADFSYGMFREQDGAITTIADREDGIQDFSVPALNEREQVAFVASFPDNRRAVLVGDGERLRTLVDTTGPYSDINSFRGVGFNNRGQVAFGATLDAGGEGIFTGPNPIRDRVIGSGDRLARSTVFSLVVCRFGLNQRGQIAFLAVLDDGRELIVRATPR